jgi:hypothetical protein
MSGMSMSHFITTTLFIEDGLVNCAACGAAYDSRSREHFFDASDRFGFDRFLLAEF